MKFLTIFKLSQGAQKKQKQKKKTKKKQKKSETLDWAAPPRTKPGEKFEFSLLMHEINVLTFLNYPSI